MSTRVVYFDRIHPSWNEVTDGYDIPNSVQCVSFEEVEDLMGQEPSETSYGGTYWYNRDFDYILEVDEFGDIMEGRHHEMKIEAEVNKSAYEINGVRFINMTPHAIDIQDENGVMHQMPAAKYTMRADEVRRNDIVIAGFKASVPKYGLPYCMRVEDIGKKSYTVYPIPSPQVNTFYVVSALTMIAAQRVDIIATGVAIRDEVTKQQKGAIGFSYLQAEKIQENTNTKAQEFVARIEEVKASCNPSKMEEFLTELAQYISDDKNQKAKVFDVNKERIHVLSSDEFVMGTFSTERVGTCVDFFSEKTRISKEVSSEIKKCIIDELESYNWSKDFIDRDSLEDFLMQTASYAVEEKLDELNQNE